MATEFIAAKLLTVAANLEIDSDTQFRFADNVFSVYDPLWGLPPAPYVSPRNRFLHAVSLALYYGAYCCRHDSEMVVPPVNLVIDREFVERLSNANQTRRTVEHGWQSIHREPDQTLHVVKGGRRRVAFGGQYRCTSPTGVDSGALYSLPVLREDRDGFPMFYLAYSEALPNQSEDLDNVRFYFHCDQHSVFDVVRSVTGMLNRHAVPFRLKCLDHPQRFFRADAAVLYVEKRFAAFVTRCLVSLHQANAFQLSERVPLFSKSLLQGIGIAEDPGDGQSFGQHRCRLLAEALVEAHDSACLHDDGVWEFIERRFRSAGLDLSFPHVNAGSIDWYASPVQQEVAR